MTGETEATSSDSTSGEVSPDLAAPPEAAPTWFAEYAAKVDGRLSGLGKDLGRIRERLPKNGANGANGKASTADPAVTSSEPMDATPDLGPEWQKQFRDLTRREASLSEEAIQWLDNATEGMDLSTRGRVLDAYLAGTAATAGKAPDPKPVTPGGRAATAATRHSVVHPTSKAEYVSLYRKAKTGDKQAARTLEVLDADPTFTGAF